MYSGVGAVARRMGRHSRRLGAQVVLTPDGVTVANMPMMQSTAPGAPVLMPASPMLTAQVARQQLDPGEVPSAAQAAAIAAGAATIPTSTVPLWLQTSIITTNPQSVTAQAASPAAVAASKQDALDLLARIMAPMTPKAVPSPGLPTGGFDPGVVNVPGGIISEGPGFLPPLLPPSTSGTTPLPGSFPTGPVPTAPGPGEVPSATDAATIVTKEKAAALPGAVAPDGSMTPATSQTGLTAAGFDPKALVIIGAVALGLMFLTRKRK